MKKTLFLFSFIFIFASASKAQDKTQQKDASLSQQYKEKVTSILSNIPSVASEKANEVMDFAKSLMGVRYRYGSSNPKNGFDCSGFVSYVYKQFGFTGARSSSDFAQKGKPVKLAEAKVGDVLVFTGTNAKSRRPGHVGIIYSKDEDGNIKFIHASSGRAHGVTVTDLEGYYKTRFLKAVTVLE
jgi:lipoprotein Spr